jgi:hypothetical protein
VKIYRKLSGKGKNGLRRSADFSIKKGSCLLIHKPLLILKNFI